MGKTAAATAKAEGVGVPGGPAKCSTRPAHRAGRLPACPSVRQWDALFIAATAIVRGKDKAPVMVEGIDGSALEGTAREAGRQSARMGSSAAPGSGSGDAEPPAALISGDRLL